MSSSKLHFMDLKTQYGNNLEDKFRKLILAAGLKSLIVPGELVAIKVHVGERGNLGYVNHNYARVVVEEVKKLGGKPFLTDTNTLYSGGRHNAVDHVLSAAQHGFSLASIGAPFIVADGLRGLDFNEVEINLKHIKKAKIATGILKADKIIFLSHFKGHLEAGFGGTIKNLAMGCCAVPGKSEQHASSAPQVTKTSCVGCRQCFHACPVKAISMLENKAAIDYEVCIGCGQCIAACNYSAINPQWDEVNDVFIEKVAEYAFAVYREFQNKALYVNFAINITPDCDCWPANDVPVVHDVGILAGLEPLALDHGTLDLINQAHPNPDSELAGRIKNRNNIFHQIRERIDSDRTFTYCESLGMPLNYTLEKII